jgi:hypothetical protein
LKLKKRPKYPRHSPGGKGFRDLGIEEISNSSIPEFLNLLANNGNIANIAIGPNHTRNPIFTKLL